MEYGPMALGQYSFDWPSIRFKGVPEAACPAGPLSYACACEPLYLLIMISENDLEVQQHLLALV